MRIDLRGCSCEAVANFIFGHPVADDPEEEDGWWWGTEFVFDPIDLVMHLVAIFRSAASLPAHFSREQLEQGFWLLISPWELGLEELIHDRQIPWPARAELIASTVDLYRDLFAHDPLETSSHMFWDALAYGYGSQPRQSQLDPEHVSIQDAMFAALSQILELPSLPCQRAALHGLGHLRHPATEALVTKYLAARPELAEADRAYAMACVRGEVQ
jgi:hypothetical protein